MEEVHLVSTRPDMLNAEIAMAVRDTVVGRVQGDHDGVHLRREILPEDEKKCPAVSNWTKASCAALVES